MNRLLQWMVSSTQFKKWNGIVGGFCAGLWVALNYWREIKGTLEVWGIDKETWADFLLAVVGASGILLSVGLSAAKSRASKKVSFDQSIQDKGG